mmetsp:Transcript_37328/g.49181  ORF Transcript_37328/g.49181 Transcript_37328/m.49181 type:complete len:460 (+) Transcript_37328:49-1428(+)
MNDRNASTHFDSDREISSFAIAPSVLEILMKNGFRIVKDFQGLSPLDISKEAGIEMREAWDVFKMMKKATRSKQSGLNPSKHPASSQQSQSTLLSQQGDGVSARDLLKKVRNIRPIITFCRGIDEMLGGGIMRGVVTEICGEPGVGKTQFGIQLAVDAQLPSWVSGVEGKTVYIDTEGSFMVERAVQVAEGFVHHLNRIAKSRQQRQLAGGQVQQLNQVLPTRDQILQGILVFRAHDHTEQIAMVRYLSTFMKKNPEVKLVVLDSIAFHFRHGFAAGQKNNMGGRTKILSDMAQRLTKLAQEHDVAVVVINQMTTKIDSMAAGSVSNSRLVPALGETWAHAATNRILLFWQDGERKAKLFKSPWREAKTVSYQVTAVGIRDPPLLPPPQPALHHHPKNNSPSQNQGHMLPAAGGGPPAVQNSTNMNPASCYNNNSNNLDSPSLHHHQQNNHKRIRYENK